MRAKGHWWIRGEQQVVVVVSRCAGAAGQRVCSDCQCAQMSLKSPGSCRNQSQLSSGASPHSEYSFSVFLTTSSKVSRVQAVYILLGFFFFHETICEDVQVEPGGALSFSSTKIYSFPMWLWEAMAPRSLRFPSKPQSHIVKSVKKPCSFK